MERNVPIIIIILFAVVDLKAICLQLRTSNTRSSIPCSVWRLWDGN